MIDRRQLQAFHPFVRLNRLLEGEAPGNSGAQGGEPIALSVGEPRNQPPAFVAEEIARTSAGWARYPPQRGTPEYLEAAAAWLCRRYGLPESAAGPGGLIDTRHCLLPVPGTREGLFFAVLANAPLKDTGEKPVVLIPSPSYHVYAAAASAAGAEIVLVPAHEETGFLPDFSALDPEILRRATFCFLNSPSNPQGAVADIASMQSLIRLAREYDFVVAFDECYAEIYTGEPPPGALEAALGLDGSLDKMLIFHSLSKRSSAPGLRCGFVAGAPDLIDSLNALLLFGGAGVPLPVLAAGTRLWQDEEHVVQNRLMYQRNFELAERILGNRFGFRKPGGGFFLWLDVGDGEAAALELWRRGGIKVLPGGYMATSPNAAQEGPNPGESFIRVALVYDDAVTEAALGRLAGIL